MQLLEKKNIICSENATTKSLGFENKRKENPSNIYVCVWCFLFPDGLTSAHMWDSSKVFKKEKTQRQKSEKLTDNFQYSIFLLPELS